MNELKVSMSTWRFKVWCLKSLKVLSFIVFLRSDERCESWCLSPAVSMKGVGHLDRSTVPHRDIKLLCIVKPRSAWTGYSRPRFGYTRLWVCLLSADYRLGVSAIVITRLHDSQFSSNCSSSFVQDSGAKCSIDIYPKEKSELYPSHNQPEASSWKTWK